MAAEPEERRPDGSPPESGRNPSGDAEHPDATRRFDPVAPDADAGDATARLGTPVSDDEALRWDGDEATERLAPAGSHPARPAERSGAAAGSALLIVSGAFLGIYLLMTIGWIATALRYEPTTADPLGAFMQRLSALLAVASPAFWFGVTYRLTRGRPAWQRITWLTLGVLLVTPWPLVTGSLG